MVEAIGLAAGSCTTFSFLPQLLTVVRRRSGEDLSYGYLTIFGTGLVLWFIYGVIVDSFAVMAANAMTISLVIAIAVLKWKYHREHLAGGDRPVAQP